MSEQPADYTPAADTVAALRFELMALEAELPALYQRVGELHVAHMLRRKTLTHECAAAIQQCYEQLDAITALRARIDAAQAEATIKSNLIVAQEGK